METLAFHYSVKHNLLPSAFKVYIAKYIPKEEDLAHLQFACVYSNVTHWTVLSCSIAVQKNLTGGCNPRGGRCKDYTTVNVSLFRNTTTLKAKRKLNSSPKFNYFIVTVMLR